LFYITFKLDIMMKALIVMVIKQRLVVQM